MVYLPTHSSFWKTSRYVPTRELKDNIQLDTWERKCWSVEYIHVAQGNISGRIL